MIDRLRVVPAWGWLAAIVALSFALRAWLARGPFGPFIMVDELIYSELARSFAAGDGFRIRDVPATGFGVVYPVLISPAYALFDALPTAYAGGEDAERARDVAGGGARLLARAPGARGRRSRSSRRCSPSPCPRSPTRPP